MLLRKDRGKARSDWKMKKMEAGSG